MAGAVRCGTGETCEDPGAYHRGTRLSRHPEEMY